MFHRKNRHHNSGLSNLRFKKRNHTQQANLSHYQLQRRDKRLKGCSSLNGLSDIQFSKLGNSMLQEPTKKSELSGSKMKSFFKNKYSQQELERVQEALLLVRNKYSIKKSIYKVFNSYSKSKKGLLSLQELRDFLAVNSVTLNEKELSLFAQYIKEEERSAAQVTVEELANFVTDFKSAGRRDVCNEKEIIIDNDIKLSQKKKEIFYQIATHYQKVNQLLRLSHLTPQQVVDALPIQNSHKEFIFNNNLLKEYLTPRGFDKQCFLKHVGLFRSRRPALTESKDAAKYGPEDIRRTDSLVTDRIIKKSIPVRKYLLQLYPELQKLKEEFERTGITQTLSRRDLEVFMKSKLVDCQKVGEQNFQAFLNLFQYNRISQTSRSKLLNVLFNETRNQYESRIQQRQIGPPPLLDSQPAFESCDPHQALDKLDRILGKIEGKHGRLCKRFDKDQDGIISREDIEESLLKLGSEEREVRQIMGFFNSLEQKSFNYQQFIRVIKKQNDSRVNPNSTVPNRFYLQQVRLKTQQKQTTGLFQTQHIPLSKASRFTSTPIHKNTFTNFRCENEEEGWRFDRTEGHRQRNILEQTKFQKIKSENRIRRIRVRQQTIDEKKWQNEEKEQPACVKMDSWKNWSGLSSWVKS